MKSIFSDLERNQMFEMAQAGLSLTQIIDQLEQPKKYRGNIFEIIRRRGTTLYREPQRKYSFDNTIFDSIDSEEKAYWLGFLIGDGSVTENSLVLELSNKDLDHLHKFKSFMKANHPIYPTRKNCSVIHLSDRTFLPKLTQYGLIRNKTKSVMTPNILPIYFKSFYHGILDSDGWITAHKHKRGITQYEFGWCSANKQFLEEIKLWIETKLNLSKLGYISDRHTKNGSVCQYIIGGNNNFVKLYNLFYLDSTVYLDRKRQLATKFCVDIFTRIDGRTTRWNRSQ